MAETTSAPFRTKNPRDINVLVAGCTGSTGKFVVRELVKRAFNFIAVARERSAVRDRNGKEETLNELKGANICLLNVMSLDLLGKSVESLGSQLYVVVSCLAGRLGGVSLEKSTMRRLRTVPWQVGIMGPRTL